ncbi:MAG: lysophospholipase [Oscillospiraceae bacterium]|nr:lysophospholipase [Oscillospiraceae bacterium]
MDHNHSTFSFPSHTLSTDVFVQSLSPANPADIKGVIQIVHGMAEHTDRYIDVAKYLCDRGYAVIMNDHAGHGRSVKSDENNGYFCDKDGWLKLVDDVYEVTKLAKKEYPEKKIIIWGHSMGSFITRKYIAKYKNAVDAAIICGTSGANPGAAVGIILAGVIGAVKGKKHKSKLINGIAFGSYNKRFEGSTGFEWLSVNEENVAKYMADPKCGFLFSAAGYKDLFSVLKAVSSQEWYSDVPSAFPILLISGADDPVGAYGKGVREVYDKLNASGHTNISIKLYEGLRHEIHNEKSNAEVYCDIADFADKITNN